LMKTADMLKQKGTHVEVVVMSDEVKAHWAAIANDLVAWLEEHCKGPVEAYAIMYFARRALEETYGIGGVITIKEREES
jgi:hypothetical protein